jgi:hypothetical protein
MSFPIKRTCLLLLALPLLAVADPVSVTTHSTGIHNTTGSTLGTTNSMLAVLGLDPLTSTAPLPYALTLTSTFDTDSLPNPETFLAQAKGDVVIDFRLGPQVVHYAGPAISIARLAAQSPYVEEFSHTIFLDTPNYRYGFVHDLLAPSGTLSQTKPLAPFDVDESALTSFSAGFFFNLFAEPIDFSVTSTSTTMSVHVSAVPEPASFALLAAGLATLALPWLLSGRARRMRREIMLGGASRTVLHRAPLPVLLAH